MQFQANILGTPVERPEITESTALGAAYLAGISCSLWSINDIRNKRKVDRIFNGEYEQSEINRLYSKWKDAVKRSMNWVND